MSEADDSGIIAAPALITGTSSEFIGKRALPRVVSARQVAVVLGPSGVGKSTVARVLAGERRLELGTRDLERGVLRRVRTGGWDDEWLATSSLVLDGPVWLRHRSGVVQLLSELARTRAERRFRTVFVQSDSDGSIEELFGEMEVGSCVVIGLRFPRGRRARMRIARRLCDELGLPRQAAAGSEQLDPWRYDRLVGYLVETATRGDS
jgi:energy-coupling factor transporter ATP-binding protein EcfA2